MQSFIKILALAKWTNVFLFLQGLVIIKVGRLKTCYAYDMPGGSARWNWSISEKIIMHCSQSHLAKQIHQKLNYLLLNNNLHWIRIEILFASFQAK